MSGCYKHRRPGRERHRIHVQANFTWCNSATGRPENGLNGFFSYGMSLGTSAGVTDYLCPSVWSGGICAQIGMGVRQHDAILSAPRTLPVRQF